jgi:ribonuclease Z
MRCWASAAIRLFQLHVPLSQVGPLFLTYFHSDHTSCIPDVWLSGWLGGPWARRTAPFRVIGPTGAKQLMLHLAEAYKADINTRIADEHYPAEGVRFIVDEFSAGGLVYEKDGVRHRVRSGPWRPDQPTAIASIITAIRS